MTFGLLLLLFLFSLVEAPEIQSNQSVKANEGDTVILPCSKKTQVEVSRVEWVVVQEDGDKDVHLYRQGEDDLSEQSEEYKNRTALLNQTIIFGNYSLTLTNLRKSDNGTYKCTFILKEEEYVCYVTLTVPPRQSKDSKKNNPSGEETKDNTGLPWWGWVLLVLGLIAAVLLCFYICLKCNQRNTSNTNAEEIEMPERRPLNTV